MLTVISWLEFIPPNISVWLIFAGCFALVFVAATATRKYANQLMRLIRWNGVSVALPKGGIGIFASKEMAATNRDMVIWSDVDCRITGVDFQCFNFSTKPIDSVLIECRSKKTNEEYECFLDGMPPNETCGIPGRCSFVINVRFPRSTPDKEGYTIDDFKNFCGNARLTAQLDGASINKNINSGEILAAAFSASLNLAKPPIDRPRVMKKMET